MFHVEQAWVEAFRQDALQMQLPLGNKQIQQFQRYLKELKTWNAKTNLTAITDDREIAIKHFLDSLMYSKVLAAGPLLDIGTGAGFPALPIKILDPELDVTVLEPNRKKTAFLHHVIGTLQLANVTVLSQRVEALADNPRFRGQFMNVVTRAVNVRSILLSVRSLIAGDGRLILCRSRPLEAPSSDRFHLIKEVPYSLPAGLGQRVLSVLQPKAA
jgi:16S rRNA (guanine527-N7)-methyltransferase